MILIPSQIESFKILARGLFKFQTFIKVSYFKKLPYSNSRTQLTMESFDVKVKDLCLKLYDIGVLKFGDFKMKVGMNSPIYFDLRVIVSFPTVLGELADLIQEFISHQNVEPKLFCGVPYTALPIATAVSVKSGVPMVIRRKEKKGYGTMKLIEGKFSEGDICVIIEDVVTSGSSVLETTHDLTHDGLVVQDAIVILDREQGGIRNLKNHGIKMHSLLNFTKVLQILYSHNKIEQSMVDKVKQYLANHQITPNGEPLIEGDNRMTLSFESRSNIAKCVMSRQLFQLMERKKSNLCVAVDVKTKDEFLKIVKEVAPYAAVIKTHYDAVKDWDRDVENQLVNLSTEHDFLIMEDRKCGDIGQTVMLQCESIFRWAHMITMHSICGNGSLLGAAEAASNYLPKGIFLVAQLSCRGNLITPSYTKFTVELSKEQSGLVAGIVCQSADVVSDPGLIQLTPGVSTHTGSDSMGQQYVSIEEAILHRGADLAVIGRSITKCPNPGAEAKSAKEALWNAYLSRII